MNNLKYFLLENEKDINEVPDNDLLTQLGEFTDSLEFDEDENLEQKILDIYNAYTELLISIDLNELDESSLEEFFDILDALDIDPEDLGIDSENYEVKESKDFINEWVKKWVIRKGKKVKKLPKREGYKVKDGRYIRMSASEKMKRKRGARKGARKMKNKISQVLRKRKKSMRKRKSLIGK